MYPSGKKAEGQKSCENSAVGAYIHPERVYISHVGVLFENEFRYITHSMRNT